MYRMVLMSGVWYAKKIESFDCDSNMEDSKILIGVGDIVAFTDDVEYFADEVGIIFDTIVNVDTVAALVANWTETQYLHLNGMDRS